MKRSTGLPLITAYAQLSSLKQAIEAKKPIIVTSKHLIVNDPISGLSMYLLVAEIRFVEASTRATPDEPAARLSLESDSMTEFLARYNGEEGRNCIVTIDSSARDGAPLGSISIMLNSVGAPVLSVDIITVCVGQSPQPKKVG